MSTLSLRFVFAAALSATALGAAGLMASNPASQARAAALPPMTRAVQALAANGKSEVGVLVLSKDSPQSAYDDALMRSTAARYALRHLDMVVLRRQGDRFVPESIPGQCSGMDPCAQEILHGGLSVPEVARLVGSDTLGTSFVVLDAQGARVGQAYGGFDRLSDITTFAANLSHASVQRPALQYADAAFAETSTPSSN